MVLPGGRKWLGTKQKPGAGASSACASQNQCRILAPEGDAVCDGVLDRGGAPRLRDVIQVAVRIWRIEVDRRWKLARLHGDDRGSDSGPAACALGMAGL